MQVLLLNRFTLLAVLAGAVAFVVIVQPGWAVDPLRAAGERVAETIGAGVIPIGLWVAAVVVIAAWRRSLLLRRWRLAAGSAVLVVGIQGGLSFFEGTLPLIDEASLGGEVGDRIQGSNTLLAYLRVGAIAAAGIAIISPVHTWRTLRAAGRGTQRGAAAVRSTRGAMQDRALGRNVGDFLVARSRPTADLQPQDAFASFVRPSGAQEIEPRERTSEGRRSLEAAGRAVPDRPDAATEPRTQPIVALRTQPAAEPRTQPVVALRAQPAVQPRTQPTAEPQTEPVAQPQTEPTGELRAEPAVEPQAESTGEPYAEPAVEPHTEPAYDPWTELIGEPPTEPVVEPQTEPAYQPQTGPTGELEAPPAKPAAADGPVWVLPSITLLAEPVAEKGIEEEHWATAGLIEETLAQFGVEVSVSEIRPGPSVTMFGLVPGWNRRLRAGRPPIVGDGTGAGRESITETRGRVKVDSILAREKDLALALAAPSLRIEAPVPGEPMVGVEVPNKSSTTVTMRSVMETPEYQAMLSDDGLPVTLGLASAGEPVAVDLLKMPHLLIAGATGSGKSVCMNSIICSLIAHQSPSKVVVLLVDPKRVELTPYNGIPHLVTPVVTEPDRVVRLLRGAIEEMGRRYKLLEEAGVRNIQSYNRSPKATEHMPYFVICIDELADLMMTASFEVEQGICRLAQLGRATGIHMIVATQRPSVDVVTGLIKANFPSRIAFAVASQVDSRTILDAAGAERLIGRGDMLFLSAASPKARRVQGVLVTEEETYALAEHWQDHPPMDIVLPAIEDLAREAEEASAVRDAEVGSKEGSLYDQALQVAAINRQLSTSLLQRKLGIGYPRAARLMDELEAEGIVGPGGEAGKPREVVYLPDDIP